MLESNPSAIQGLRFDGRAREKLHPPQTLVKHQTGKHKAKNSMPKLRFGEHSRPRDFLTHLTLDNDFKGAVDKAIADGVGSGFVGYPSMPALCVKLRAYDQGT